jgi:DNA polymerase III delta prime subunit
MKNENKMSDFSIWVEKYRPDKVQDIFLPARVKSKLLKLVEENSIPNCVFTSESPGTGKTTSAIALCKEMNASYLYINASVDNSIDDIRTKVISFASTGSFQSSVKVIILDEADRLTTHAQDALKGVIEQFSSVCRFIFTANNKQGLTDPLLSRCTLDLEFSFNEKESNEVKLSLFKFLDTTLAENLGKEKYDMRAVKLVVDAYFPDNRKIIQTLQELSMSGNIDLGSVQELAKSSVDVVVNYIANKDYAELKEWTMKNYTRLGTNVYLSLYEELYPRVKDPAQKCELILTINDAQRNHKNVPDKFIHFLSLFTTIMLCVDVSS